MKLPKIPPLHVETMEETTKHVNQLTKPLGSLGQLEQIAIRLAGIQGKKIPDVSRKAVIVMCGDHGVARSGVSAYPPEVTGLMIHNFVQGKAAINVLARLAGAEVHVVDVGSYLSEVPKQVINKKVRKGTRHFAEEEAMTEEETIQAIEVGIEVVEQLKQKGVQLLAVGEMGIGNTTIATALAAVFTQKSVSELAGRGTGINDHALQQKIEVIEAALERHQPNPDQPLRVLSQLGGLEVAGMAGVYIGAAAAGIPVMVDGVISTVAALLAVKMEPSVRNYLFASHLSVEPAHAVLLDALGLQPIIQAGLRLGEASGAALAFPMFDAAVAIVREMATFADLGLPSPK
ncbi:nicotinate-nucleotide--dimethylbenzimidazole phosphoribosyltransferase [Thermoflavimicrobium dichotomicum]|uniref:Nicotinate-nucleotide--dimethylbenzimidazole phosphoribosyltransferase n=1 Tax=Thermoflavimicrobium dichotomicum TaxID=46223 RepID=A0A1I3MH15_9BACL|nr:nicotinate-nucleotide--dimethylbenzimidazole phosphoribosyltransferase [Thermoflavimicrobium dichotomicum]SFI96243.1 nicotinate-nucleotide--dimethylbenzimidazole phosphoribosyltransferase [Thermoflavimicrobium dichotomicum]